MKVCRYLLGFVGFLLSGNLAIAQPTFNSSYLPDEEWVMQVDCDPNTATYAYIEIASEHINVWADGSFHQFSFSDAPAFVQDYRLVVFGSSQNDIVEIHGTNAGDLRIQVSGLEGDDAIYNYTSNRMSAYGSEGNDQLFGGPGIDYLSGGPGEDYLNGGAGEDSLRGDEGNDQLLGEDDKDWLHGGPGADFLSGGPGNDQIYGNSSWAGMQIAGNAYLIPDYDLDVMQGGPGNDNFHHAFYYWQSITSIWNFPIATKIYHEKEFISDYQAGQDFKHEYYLPKLYIRF